jgi:anaerobic selenocysteine-containing dehydrogenase
MAYQQRVQGEQTVLMNADDAEARGIDEGQTVRVYNDNGEIQGTARIGAGDQVARGVVIVPVGHWRKVQGGPTANAITRTPFADLGNAPTFSDTRVEIAPL